MNDLLTITVNTISTRDKFAPINELKQMYVITIGSAKMLAGGNRGLWFMRIVLPIYADSASAPCG